MVYGGSAGAIILGKDIKTSPDRDNTGLNQYSGLNLVEDYSVWPHYDESDKEKIKQYIEKRSENGIAIPEESSLYVKKGIGKVIGSKEVLLFQKESISRIEPGEKINLL